MNELPNDEKMIEIIKSVYPWDYNRKAYERINLVLGFTMDREQEYHVYDLDREIVAPSIERENMAKMGFIPTQKEWLEQHVNQKVSMASTGGIFSGFSEIRGTLRRNGEWFIVLPPRCKKNGYRICEYIKAA